MNGPIAGAATGRLPAPCRVWQISAQGAVELEALPAKPPPQGFVWVACARQAFAEHWAALLQEALPHWDENPLVDLHVSDLQNPALPSSFDSTSWYDLLVFRRLAAGAVAGAGAGELGPLDAESGPAELGASDASGTRASSPPSAANLDQNAAPATAQSARLTLDSIDTSPVGFAVFERLLITVHPGDCLVREHFAQRMAQHLSSDSRSTNRMPTGPADLMLRMVNHMVDGYLNLRRQLSRQLGSLQQRLLDPRAHFHDWPVLLEARNALAQLEEVCEDQAAAVQEWLDSLQEWPAPADAHQARERELLRVRSRDVLEHIARVLSHVNRLEQSAETAVQMHFSALGHRTNQIMRTLTVLTAVFLPLNLITGFFGMNFDALPLIHNALGIWFAVAAMALVAGGLAWFFWRKRYLGGEGG